MGSVRARFLPATHPQAALLPFADFANAVEGLVLGARLLGDGVVGLGVCHHDEVRYRRFVA